MKRLEVRNLELFYIPHLNYYEMASPRIFEIHSMHKMMLDLSSAAAHLGDVYYDLHKKEDNTLDNIRELLNLTNDILDDYEKRYFKEHGDTDNPPSL